MFSEEVKALRLLDESRPIDADSSLATPSLNENSMAIVKEGLETLLIEKTLRTHPNVRPVYDSALSTIRSRSKFSATRTNLHSGAVRSS